MLRFSDYFGGMDSPCLRRVRLCLRRNDGKWGGNDGKGVSLCGSRGAG